MGHQIGKRSIPKRLDVLGYRRQVNRKTLDGSHNAGRDAQFEHINAGDCSPGLTACLLG